MSAFAIALPGALSLISRPLFGLGLLATLALIFKPLATGLMRAGLMLLNPRQTPDERSRSSKLRGVLMLNRMARDLDNTQPNLAAELRLLAARG